jgi:hypothetical protein
METFEGRERYKASDRNRRNTRKWLNKEGQLSVDVVDAMGTEK